MNSNKILRFTGKNSFLSNFYLCKVEYEGLIFPSVEHAFQAAKTLDIDERKKFQLMSDPVDAKHYGRHLNLRSDWESVKDTIMYECLKSKFSNPELSKMLLDTKSVYLEEGNNHRDMYWGTVNGIGSNKLGQLLMKVRSEL